MMLTSILVVVAALVLLLFLVAAIRGSRSKKSAVANLQGEVRPVDLIAFRNLMDPSEEQYLREHLPPRVFRAVQRARLRAALDYLRCLAWNSALLMQAGEATRHSSDAPVARAGQELLDNALRLRVYILLAEIKICLGILMPGLRLSPSNVSDRYEDLSAIVKRLGRLQDQGRDRIAVIS